MKSLLLAALTAALAWTAPLARAAEFPNQPVRIVVPFAPGGGTDVVARTVADRLSPVLGQPVVVENRPGGNSVIATRQMAGAPADGHTLLLTTDIHAINAAYGSGLPYDSLKDFAFVTQLTTSPLMLVARPAAGVRTLADVVAQARAQPGRLSFASLGPSSPHYLTFGWFKRMAGVELIDVPYKGGGQALVDLLGGQVQLSLIVAGNGIKHAKAGKLVPLAITSPARNAVAPEVPTFAESGYPELALLNWYAILAPAGTPPAVVARLAREIGVIMREPAVVERIAAAGLDPASGTPAELETLVKRDIERYRKIIALTGAKPDER
jgi:tripartite-type tricarboxylate transporter receptor subunit TctC